MPSFFCHECQTEGEDFPTDGDGSLRCPNCQSAFVEEIPPEDAGEAADDPRDFDPDDNPLANLLFGGGGAGGAGGGQGAGGQGGGQPFFQFVTPSGEAGITFTAGGNGGGFTFQAGGGGRQGGAAGAGGGGLNPLTTAMLQAFGLAPPAQGFPPRTPGARRAGEGEGEGGEEAGDPEEEHAGGPQPAQGEGEGQQQGQGGRQQVPIRNLATFLGESFGGPPPGPHPADHPDNNPFAEGGHERGRTPPPDENEQQQQQQGGPATGGPLGSLFNLLSAFGLGPAQFGLAGNAGDYVFGEQNFQTLLNDLMEQAAGRAGPQPAPDDMIEKLPRVEIMQELLDSDSITTCGICLDAFQLSETAIALPKCHHIYHQDCLVPWLKNSGTCPTCRDALVPQPGMEGATPAAGEAAWAGEGVAAAGSAASTLTTTTTEGAAPSSADPTPAASSSSFSSIVAEASRPPPQPPPPLSCAPPSPLRHSSRHSLRSASHSQHPHRALSRSTQYAPYPPSFAGGRSTSYGSYSPSLAGSPLPGYGASVVVGKVDFDINSRARGGAWYETWLASANASTAPPSTLSSALPTPATTSSVGENWQILHLPSIVASKTPQLPPSQQLQGLGFDKDFTPTAAAAALPPSRSPHLSPISGVVEERGMEFATSSFSLAALAAHVLDEPRAIVKNEDEEEREEAKESLAPEQEADSSIVDKASQALFHSSSSLPSKPESQASLSSSTVSSGKDTDDTPLMMDEQAERNYQQLEDEEEAQPLW